MFTSIRIIPIPGLYSVYYSNSRYVIPNVSCEYLTYSQLIELLFEYASSEDYTYSEYVFSGNKFSFGNYSDISNTKIYRVDNIDIETVRCIESDVNARLTKKITFEYH